MDRPCYVNLDRPNGRWSNGPPILRQFGPVKITVVDRYFGLFKNTVGDCSFGPSKIKVGDRIFEPLKIPTKKNCGEGGGQYNCMTTRSCIIMPDSIEKDS